MTKIWGFNDKYLLVTNCYGYLSISSKEMQKLQFFSCKAKYTACPTYIWCKIIVPLWIETKTAYKWVINVRTRLYAVCLFIYIFVSRSFPLPYALPGTGIERGKVFGLNTLRRRKILPKTACRPTFQLSNEVCTSFADEQRKWVIGGIGELIISQIDDRPNSNNRTYTMKSSPPFCPFIKKLYLCTSRVITFVQKNKEL